MHSRNIFIGSKTTDSRKYSTNPVTIFNYLGEIYKIETNKDVPQNIIELFINGHKQLATDLLTKLVKQRIRSTS